MSFKVPDNDISAYYRDGFIVFRQVLPASLISDLRREADKAVEIARANKGAQAQRLQPVFAYKDRLNMKPFEDYANLPALREALDQVLSPNHYYGKTDVLGLLIEPKEEPWCTHWHRDMNLQSSRLDPQEFQDIMLDWNSANQINCPLYDDECTWFVPGSHLRALDLPGEKEAAERVLEGVGWSAKAGEVGKVEPVERERRCWDYTAGMPGAVQLRLSAGDFALYRPIGWHIGNYLPYKRRATLHDGLFTPEYETWWRQWISGGSPKWTRSINRVQ